MKRVTFLKISEFGYIGKKPNKSIVDTDINIDFYSIADSNIMSMLIFAVLYEVLDLSTSVKVQVMA